MVASAMYPARPSGAASKRTSIGPEPPAATERSPAVTTARVVFNPTSTSILSIALRSAPVNITILEIAEAISAAVQVRPRAPWLRPSMDSSTAYSRPAWALGFGVTTTSIS